MLFGLNIINLQEEIETKKTDSSNIKAKTAKPTITPGTNGTGATTGTPLSAATKAITTPKSTEVSNDKEQKNTSPNFAFPTTLNGWFEKLVREVEKDYRRLEKFTPRFISSAQQQTTNMRLTFRKITENLPEKMSR